MEVLGLKDSKVKNWIGCVTYKCILIGLSCHIVTDKNKVIHYKFRVSINEFTWYNMSWSIMSHNSMTITLKTAFVVTHKSLLQIAQTYLDSCSSQQKLVRHIFGLLLQQRQVVINKILTLNRLRVLNCWRYMHATNSHSRNT